VLLVALGATASAQVRTALLYGKVSDTSGGVLPGVTVTVSSPQLIKGSVVATTDATGEWRAVALPPGTYKVSAELGGFAPAKRDGVTLVAGDQIGVNLVLGVSTVQESVTVTGLTTAVDVRSSKIAQTMGAELIASLPIARTYADVINSMPGITDGGRYTYALTQTVLGSAAINNDYLVDGQSVKHPSGYAATEFSIEAMEQVQLTTGGMSPEFGSASGGVFQFITKSGSNQFRGTAYGYLLNHALGEASNLTPALQAIGARPTAVLRDQNFGGNLGGPIVRNRLWFFGDFAQSQNVQTQAGFPNGNVEEHKRLAFVKGTWQVTNANRLSVLFNDQRRWQLPSNAAATYSLDPTAWRKQFWLPKTYNAEWQSVIRNNMMFAAQVGKLAVIEDNTFPFGSWDPSKVNGYTDTGSGFTYGTWDVPRGPFPHRDHWDMKGSFSYFAAKFLGGSHDLKVGTQFQQGLEERWMVIPNNEQLFLSSAKTCLSLSCGVPSVVRLYNLPADNKWAWRFQAEYIQDQWSLPQHLTVNMGLRFEHSNGWLPAQSGGADLQPTGFNPDLDGHSLPTFPTYAWFPTHDWPRVDNVINWNTWAPRLGVSWDPRGTGRFVLKATYGRYYNLIDGVGDGNPNGLNYAQYNWYDCRNAAGIPVSCQGLPAAQVNGDKLLTPNELGPLVSSSILSPTDAASLVTHDPNLKQPYNNDTSFGFDYAVGRGFSVSVTGILKRDHDLVGIVDPNHPWDTSFDPVQVTNPVTGVPMTIYLKKPDFASKPVLSVDTNLPQATRRYRGMEVVIKKRADNWQLMASYLYGHSVGTYGTHFNDSKNLSAQSPNNFINLYGPLSLDSPQQIKLSGSYRAPWGINLGVAYLGMTGYPTATLIGYSSIAGASFYQFRRGVDYPTKNASGQTYPDVNLVVAIEPRGTHREDFQSLLNLRAEKVFMFAGGRSLSFILDIMNTTNSSAKTQIQSERVDQTNYLSPDAIELPRRIRFGLRLQF
jgi:hypothetical protein